MPTHPLLFLALTYFLLFSKITPSISKTTPSNDDDDDDDLSFLVEDDSRSTPFSNHHHKFPSREDEDEDEDEYLDDDNYFDNYEEETETYKELEIEDSDVVVLKERNFSDVIENFKYVMVEFYAPWCENCQALAPEYAAAATELREEKEVVLAKVDATKERELAHEYDVKGFPTVHFFVDGEHTPYTGQRTKNAIVKWIKKKTGPGVYNLTDLDDAERVLTSESKLVLGYLNSLVGKESKELAAASRLEDDVNFYQTVNSDVAKLFYLDPHVKRPALVMIKQEVEKFSYFDAKFSKNEISEFVSANKLPLVTLFSRESAATIFESPIKKQLLLFVLSNETQKLLPVFQDAAKLFKGKLIFVLVEMDSEDGKPVSDYFGITGTAPQVLAYTGKEDGKKFVLDGELTLDKIKAFGKDFLVDKVKPFFKSDPVPKTNDGVVKIVVGNNFDEIVLDESKDVLLEIYAPWCGQCQAFESTYTKLAQHLKGIDSLIIAKMDGTANEHPRAKVDGFPTILFFPAGNKSLEPITVDTDRTMVALYKFLRKHASIPFKLENAVSTPKSISSNSKMSTETGNTKEEQVKDEL